jgi:sugar lactone lactonase YvrE
MRPLNKQIHVIRRSYQMNRVRSSIVIGVALAFVLGFPGLSSAQQPEKQTPKLLVELPDFCPTPDGMDIAPDGTLVVSCPNYADQTKPGCLIRIDKEGNVKKWVNVPPLERTGVSCPMGIQFGPDGDLYVCDNQGWPGTAEGKEQGRILRLRIKDGEIEKMTVVVSGMEHPNGIRVRDGSLYVTQSMLPKVQSDSGLLTSAVYRFPLDGEGIRISNSLKDEHLIVSMPTLNKDCQYGADGLVFDEQGNLYVGNFGDGAIHRITFDQKGNVTGHIVWAKNVSEMRTTDGICMDERGNIYVADFSENAVAVVTPDANVYRIAQSPDCDGSQGGLDQPGEPIVWNGKLILTCFDKVTGPDKVNTGHDKPYTMSMLDLIDGE